MSSDGYAVPKVSGMPFHLSLSVCRQQLAELQSENEDLRQELGAFEPSFFEEIEDLKHDHHILQSKCEQYEQVISNLSAQLPP